MSFFNYHDFFAISENVFTKQEPQETPKINKPTRYYIKYANQGAK